MPTVLRVRPPDPSDLPPRKRWTREECAELEASGVWARQRLELIDGDLISKMGKNRPHSNALARIHAWLQDVFGREFVNAEIPIDVSPEDNPANEPEPDAVVFSRPYVEFKGNPRPEDLRLVVEVADTTLNFDLTAKALLYARAGIAEYWVLDVLGRSLIAHRHPQSGRYSSIAVYAEHESVNPAAAPNQSFRVADAFPRIEEAS